MLVFLKNGKGRTLQQFEELNAKSAATLPAGTVMWGNAAGWRNVEQKRALWQLPKHTHKWHFNAEGIIVAPPEHDAARVQRHKSAHNEADVRVLYLGPRGVPLLRREEETEALAELAHILAGTGGAARGSTWPTWYLRDGEDMF